MKTVTKLLSMLLLVAMCLSLIGGGAYAGFGSLGGGGTDAGISGGGFGDLGGNTGAGTGSGDFGDLGGNTGAGTGSGDFGDLGGNTGAGTGSGDFGNLDGNTDAGTGSDDFGGLDGKGSSSEGSSKKSGLGIGFMLFEPGTGARIPEIDDQEHDLQFALDHAQGTEVRLDADCTVEKGEVINIPAGTYLNLAGNTLRNYGTINIGNDVIIKGRLKDGPKGKIELNSHVNVNGYLQLVDTRVIDQTVDNKAFVGGTIRIDDANATDTELTTDGDVFRNSDSSFIIVQGTFTENVTRSDLRSKVSIATGSELQPDGVTVTQIKGHFQLSSKPANKYTKLEEALDNAAAVDTITVTRTTDHVLIGDALVTNPSNITIKMNGQVLEGSLTVKKNATLNLENGTVEGIENEGTVNIGSKASVGTLHNIKSGIVNLNAGKIGTIDMEESSRLNIAQNGGITIDTLNAPNKCTIDVAENSTAKINNFYPNASGSQTIKGGYWTDDGSTKEKLEQAWIPTGYEAVSQPPYVIVQRKGTNPSTPDPEWYLGGGGGSSTGGFYTVTYGANGNLNLGRNDVSSVTVTHANGTANVIASVGGTTSYIPENRVSSILPQRCQMSLRLANGTTENAYLYILPQSAIIEPSYYVPGSGSAVRVRLYPSSPYYAGIAYNGTILSSGTHYTRTDGAGSTDFTLNNSYLNSFSYGQYRFQYVMDGGNGAPTSNYLTISNSGSSGGSSGSSGSSYNPYYDDIYYYDGTGYQLIPVNGKYYWESGSGSYGFRRSQIDYKNGGHVEIDGVTVPGDQYYDNGTDAFYIPADYITKKLGPGAHYMRVYFDRYNYRDLVFDVGPVLTYSTNKHVINSAKDLIFECSDPITEVRVGGQLLTNYGDTNYVLSNNGRRLTLKASFLNARTAGTTYTLSVKTQAGYTADAPFYILTAAQASASPRTGDDSNIVLWVAFMIISGGTIAVALPRLKKNMF